MDIWTEVEEIIENINWNASDIPTTEELDELDYLLEG